MHAIATLFVLSLGLLPQTGRQVPARYHSKDSDLAIKVKVDGELIKFVGTAPVMEGSRILVPLRGVFEKMGSSLDWNPDSRTVTALGTGDKVVVKIGANRAKVGDRWVPLDQPAMIIDNSTFVPLRFLSESLGAKVDWLTADRTVEIVTNKSGGA